MVADELFVGAPLRIDFRYFSGNCAWSAFAERAHFFFHGAFLYPDRGMRRRRKWGADLPFSTILVVPRFLSCRPVFYLLCVGGMSAPFILRAP